MMFYIFTRACKKYRFAFTLNAINDLSLALHPYDALGYIEVKQEYYDRSYSKLFIKAIKRMKAYREGSERL